MSGDSLHIVHTEASNGWGGQEIRILTEAQGMRARGHRITLLASPTAQIFPAAKARGIPVEAMPFEKKSLRGLWAMRRWLKQNTCDVINTHSSTDSWLVALAQIGLNRQVPVVRTRHVSVKAANNWGTRWLYGKACSQVVTTGERLRVELMNGLALAPERVHGSINILWIRTAMTVEECATRYLADLQAAATEIVESLRTHPKRQPAR